MTRVRIIRYAKQWALAYTLILPTIVFILLFTVIPAVNTIRDSLYRPAIAGRPRTFVGVQNYADLLDEDHFLGTSFRRVLVNTFRFVPTVVGASLPIAFVFALLVRRGSRFAAIVRFSFFHPALLPIIGAASIWAFLYVPNSGLFNTLLNRWGLQSVGWLGDPRIVLGSIALMMIWKQSGYFMIYYLAGLQGISREVQEAATLEGVSWYQRLYYVTLPLLMRTHQFVLTIGVIGAFQWVDQLAALGQGAPNNHGNLLLFFILQRLGEMRNWGYVNAMTVFIIAVVFSMTLINFVLFERQYR